MASLTKDKVSPEYRFNFDSECYLFYQGIKNIGKNDIKIKSKLIEYLKGGIERKSLPHKTHWINVKELLMLIKRNPDHFMKFAEFNLRLKIEKKTTSLRDGWFLLMKNVSSDMIKEMIKTYCYEYVRCDEKGCMSYNSKLKFNSKLKSWELTCRSCQKKKVVKDIESNS